ncbi:MAG: hypothetical protein LUG98_03725 [Tannerellaceae bacterium]|nr:hypothetical protein [Tannerellaceae bacterium]
MNTDLQNKKLSAIQAVLSLEDDVILDDFLTKLQRPLPCQFTSEEKWAQLEQAKEEQAAGKYVPHDKVMDRYKKRFS